MKLTHRPKRTDVTSELFTEVEIRSSPYFPRGKKGKTSEVEFWIIFNCRHITACGVDYKLESNRLNSGSTQSLRPGNKSHIWYLKHYSALCLIRQKSFYLNMGLLLVSHLNCLHPSQNKKNEELSTLTRLSKDKLYASWMNFWPRNGK